MDKGYVAIPVLGRVAAGVPINAIEDIIGYKDVPKSWVRDAEIYALQINGDSMEPRIASGDVVIIKAQQDLQSGEVGIVLVGDQDATCKKVVKQEDGIILVSNNPKYPPVFYSNYDIKHLPVTIIGRVIELRAEF